MVHASSTVRKSFSAGREIGEGAQSNSRPRARVGWAGTHPPRAWPHAPAAARARPAGCAPASEPRPAPIGRRDPARLAEHQARG